MGIDVPQGLSNTTRPEWRQLFVHVWLVSEELIDRSKTVNELTIPRLGDPFSLATQNDTELQKALQNIDWVFFGVKSCCRLLRALCTHGCIALIRIFYETNK